MVSAGAESGAATDFEHSELDGPDTIGKSILQPEPTPEEREADEPVTPMTPPSLQQTDTPPTALALPADPSAVAAVAIPLAAPLSGNVRAAPSEDTWTPSLTDTTASRSTQIEPTSLPQVPPPPPAIPEPSPPPDLAQSSRPADLGTGQLVRLLQERLSDLVSVAEVADAVIADAVDRVKATAGALLVPDGESWRVSGGVGLRALEERLVLDEESWLVIEVARAGQGVIVEDSDIARNPLKGAPLASWQHLLLAPIARVEAILVLARADSPFDESDLTRLIGLSKEAGPLLQTAMETRALARSLAAFTDGEPG